MSWSNHLVYYICYLQQRVLQTSRATLEADLVNLLPELSDPLKDFNKDWAGLAESPSYEENEQRLKNMTLHIFNYEGNLETEDNKDWIRDLALYQIKKEEGEVVCKTKAILNILTSMARFFHHTNPHEIADFIEVLAKINVTSKSSWWSNFNTLMKTYGSITRFSNENKLQYLTDMYYNWLYISSEDLTYPSKLYYQLKDEIAILLQPFMPLIKELEGSLNLKSGTLEGALGLNQEATAEQSGPAANDASSNLMPNIDPSSLQKAALAFAQMERGEFFSKRNEEAKIAFAQMENLCDLLHSSILDLIKKNFNQSVVDSYENNKVAETGHITTLPTDSPATREIKDLLNQILETKSLIHDIDSMYVPMLRLWSIYNRVSRLSHDMLQLNVNNVMQHYATQTNSILREILPKFTPILKFTIRQIEQMEIESHLQPDIIANKLGLNQICEGYLSFCAGVGAELNEFPPFYKERDDYYTQFIIDKKLEKSNVETQIREINRALQITKKSKNKNKPLIHFAKGSLETIKKALVIAKIDRGMLQPYLEELDEAIDNNSPLSTDENNLPYPAHGSLDYLLELTAEKLTQKKVSLEQDLQFINVRSDKLKVKNNEAIARTAEIKREIKNKQLKLTYHQKIRAFLGETRALISTDEINMGGYGFLWMWRKTPSGVLELHKLLKDDDSMGNAVKKLNQAKAIVMQRLGNKGVDAEKSWFRSPEVHQFYIDTLIKINKLEQDNVANSAAVIEEPNAEDKVTESEFALLRKIDPNNSQWQELLDQFTNTYKKDPLAEQMDKVIASDEYIAEMENQVSSQDEDPDEPFVPTVRMQFQASMSYLYAYLLKSAHNNLDETVATSFPEINSLLKEQILAENYFTVRDNSDQAKLDEFHKVMQSINFADNDGDVINAYKSIINLTAVLAKLGKIISQKNVNDISLALINAVNVLKSKDQGVIGKIQNSEGPLFHALNQLTIAMENGWREPLLELSNNLRRFGDGPWEALVNNLSDTYEKTDPYTTNIRNLAYEFSVNCQVKDTVSAVFQEQLSKFLKETSKLDSSRFLAPIANYASKTTQTLVDFEFGENGLHNKALGAKSPLVSHVQTLSQGFQGSIKDSVNKFFNESMKERFQAELPYDPDYEENLPAREIKLFMNIAHFADELCKTYESDSFYLTKIANLTSIASSLKQYINEMKYDESLQTVAKGSNKFLRKMLVQVHEILREVVINVDSLEDALYLKEGTLANKMGLNTLLDEFGTICAIHRMNLFDLSYRQERQKKRKSNLRQNDSALKEFHRIHTISSNLHKAFEGYENFAHLSVENILDIFDILPSLYISAEELEDTKITMENELKSRVTNENKQEIQKQIKEKQFQKELSDELVKSIAKTKPGYTTNPNTGWWATTVSAAATVANWVTGASSEGDVPYMRLHRNIRYAKYTFEAKIAHLNKQKTFVNNRFEKNKAVENPQAQLPRSPQFQQELISGRGTLFHHESLSGSLQIQAIPMSPLTSSSSRSVNHP